MGFPIEIELEIRKSDELAEAEAEAEAEVEAEVEVEVEMTAEDAVATMRLEFGRWSHRSHWSHWSHWWRWIAVGGGLGYVPIAPGTAGSLGGVLLFLLALGAGAELPRTDFVALYALSVGFLLLLGIRAAGRAEIDFGRRDDGRIVIDEVVGQMITLAPLAWFLPISSESPELASEDLSVLFLEVVTGFVLFRLFDIWKPGVIRWAERRFEGGFGVMADDVVASLYAGSCLWAFDWLVHVHGLGFERFFSSSGSLGVPV